MMESLLASRYRYLGDQFVAKGQEREREWTNAAQATFKNTKW